MQFIVTGLDGTDPQALERRMKAREAHLMLGGEMRKRGVLLYAVALLDSSGNMAGSVCIVELPSRAEVDAWLKQEPYVSGDVWRTITVQECRVGPSFAV